MANTKAIKLNDGTNDLMPVSVASVVQYSYSATASMSVQDAIKQNEARSYTNEANISIIAAAALGTYVKSGTTADKIEVNLPNGSYSTITINDVAHATASDSATKATNIAGGAQGSIPYQSAANTTVFLEQGTAGQILKMGSDNKPAWEDHTHTAGMKSTNGTASAGQKIQVQVDSNSYSNQLELYKANDNGTTSTYGVVKFGTAHNQAAHGDHTHDYSDIYAPIGHVDAKASTSAYGHVIVDNTVTRTSENPVQSKAIISYLDTALAGLTGAMHFKDGNRAAQTAPEAGDVVLEGNKEYVYTGSEWKELGDEGSHALKDTTWAGGEGLTGSGTLASAISIAHATAGTVTKATYTNTARTLASGSKFKIPTISVDKFGHVASYSDVELTFPTIPTIPNLSKNGTGSTYYPEHGGTFNVAYNIQVNGHTISYNEATIHLPADNNTANAAVGAKASKKVPIYIGTDETPTSGGFKLVEGANVSLTVSGSEITVAATDTNTHWASKTVLASSASGTTDVTAKTNNPYLNHIENNAVVSKHQIEGTGAITAYASSGTDAKLTIYSPVHELGMKYIPLGDLTEEIDLSVLGGTVSLAAGTAVELAKK